MRLGAGEAFSDFLCIATAGNTPAAAVAQKKDSEKERGREREQNLLCTAG